MTYEYYIVNEHLLHAQVLIVLEALNELLVRNASAGT